MKLKTFLALALSAVLLLSCLAGCAGQEPAETPAPTTAPAETAAPAETTAAAEAAAHQVVDVLDREVTVKDDPQRVVVTFNLEEYFAVAGAEGVDTLVGFSHNYWKGRRQDAWDTFTAAYPALAEKADVGYNDSISVETILSLQPDLVIMSAPVNYDFIEPHLPKLEQAGIPVIFVNYHKQTLELHEKSTMALGQALGKTEKAQEICQFYAQQMALITDTVATIPADAQLPKVYMEFSRGVDEYGGSWGKKMWGALIGTCGGENVAYDFGDGNSVDVNPELVIAANPDVIILAGSPQKDMDTNVVLGYTADAEKAVTALEAYKGRNGWENLSAVQNNRMGAVYHDLSRHIFDFAGAQMLAKMIHPELFGDLDPEANLQEFFDRFMPVKLSGTWMISLAQ